MNWSRALRAGLGVVLALSLGGCLSLGGTKPPPSLFSLTAASTAPAGAAATTKLENALVVLVPETDRRLSVQRVPVQVSDASVAYLKDAMWVEPPARLFGALLAETIRAKGTRLVLSADDVVGAAGSRLSGRLVEMGYDARNGSVIVRYDALLSAADGTVSTRRFEHVIDGVPAKAGSVGPALNEAANAVAAEVAEWVG